MSADVRARLDAMQARAEAATEGPWEAYGTTVAAGHGYDCDPGCRCAANLASGRGGNLTPIPPTHVLWKRINDREGIARVLGEHAPEEANYEVWFCECDPGGREDAVQRTTAEHAHHQADALIAHLTGGAR